MLLLGALLRDRAALSGALIVLTAVMLVMLGGHIVPYPHDAYATDLLHRLAPPEPSHVFGTDDLGRDVFSRVVLGTGNSLGIGLGVVGVAILIGVPLGLLAGYFEGWGSQLIMRVTDVFLAVPSLILAIVLAQLLRPGLGSAIIALSLTYWPHFTRSVCAETVKIKSTTFIEALRSIGMGSSRIIFMHILPNIASSIIVRATVGMGYVIMTAAVLGFLGIGVPPPNPDWGAAIAASQQHLPEAWWLAAFPGFAIFISVLGFNLLGDGLRDVIDPRLRHSR
ncbi:MAG TPA: ABC transporter permease [Methylocella sp.]|nr:ABC transporter permease [Methylocella sp.]